MSYHHLFFVTATKKLAEAEEIFAKLQKSTSRNEFQLEMGNFVKTIQETFSHLLDEYNKKFDLRIERIGLEKFKAKAKKMRRIEVINFLIWYEKEYRKIKNERGGYLLEKDNLNFDLQNAGYVIEDCSYLLNRTKTMAYYAYENF